MRPAAPPHTHTGLKVKISFLCGASPPKNHPTMPSTYFKFKAHPGDLFRNAEEHELPDPDADLEAFLVWFLDDYQKDSRLAYIDDLAKRLDGVFDDGFEMEHLGLRVEKASKLELDLEIAAVEKTLKAEAYSNFYRLLLEHKIEIRLEDEKQ